MEETLKGWALLCTGPGQGQPADLLGYLAGVEAAERTTHLVRGDRLYALDRHPYPDPAHFGSADFPVEVFALTDVGAVVDESRDSWPAKVGGDRPEVEAFLGFCATSGTRTRRIAYQMKRKSDPPSASWAPGRSVPAA